MKNKKTILVILLIILLFSFIIFLFYKKNFSEDILMYQEVKIVKDIEFTKANILKKGDKYIFVVTVHNTSDKDLSYENIDGVVKNKEGKTIDTLSFFLGDLNVNEYKEIETETKKDLSEIYDIEYKIY